MAPRTDAVGLVDDHAGQLTIGVQRLEASLQDCGLFQRLFGLGGEIRWSVREN